MSALCKACKTGDNTLAIVLIQSSASPTDLVNYQNGRPLHIPAKHGHTYIVGLLLSYGARPYPRVCIAMRAAIRHGYEDILKLLLDHSDIGRVVRLASFNGYPSLVREALAYSPFAARYIHHVYSPLVLRAYFQAGDMESILGTLDTFSEEQASYISAHRVIRKRAAY